MIYDEPRLVWTSLTITHYEHGGKGYCVKGGWGEEGERVKERALGVVCQVSFCKGRLILPSRSCVTLRSTTRSKQPAWSRR
jgi:hypothetical protein